MGVAQVVEPDSGQSAVECRAVEELADRFGIDGFAVSIGEDGIVESGGLSVALLSAAPSGEDLLGVGVEIDRPSTCCGFGGDFDGAALDARPETGEANRSRVGEMNMRAPTSIAERG